MHYFVAQKAAVSCPSHIAHPVLGLLMDPQLLSAHLLPKEFLSATPEAPVLNNGVVSTSLATTDATLS